MTVPSLLTLGTGDGGRLVVSLFILGVRPDDDLSVRVWIVGLIIFTSNSGSPSVADGTVRLTRARGWWRVDDPLRVKEGARCREGTGTSVPSGIL